MKKKRKIISLSPAQTKQTGEKMAKVILKESPVRTRALLIGLEGNLGSGKTTFIQGFAKGLGIKQKITSPTFVIIKKFQVSSYQEQVASLPVIPAELNKFQDFYHIDCYRIEKPEEILDLGFQKIISNSKNIICLEWAEKIKKI